MKRTIRALAVFGAAALVLSGCTLLGGAQKPSRTNEFSKKEAISKINAASRNDRTIAHANGTINNSPVVAEIVSITSRKNDTLLKWRLRSKSGEAVSTLSEQLSTDSLSDTRLIALTNPQTHETYRAFTYVPNKTLKRDTGCMCSEIAHNVTGQGVVMYSMLAKLPSGTKTVTVTMPGFDDMKDVPVTR